jgi:hypothetical protein
VSRHRFLVEVERGGDGHVSVEMPPDDAQVDQPLVPLTRLVSRATATIETRDDFARLEQIVSQLDRGALVLDGPLPVGLLDSCRFGGRRCVTDEPAESVRAAAAILDASGGVRPCTHGLPIGRVSDSLAELIATQKKADLDLQERRGCATCSALVHCARCQFPLVLDERAYCEFMRAHPTGLERWATVLEVLEELGRSEIPPSDLRIRCWGGEPLLFAQHRPRLPEAPSPSPTLTARWRGSLTWVIGVGTGEDARYGLAWVGWVKLGFAEIDALTAELGELIADDATHAELEAYVRARGLPRESLDRALETIARSIP